MAVRGLNEDTSNALLYLVMFCQTLMVIQDNVPRIERSVCSETHALYTVEKGNTHAIVKNSELFLAPSTYC